MSSIENNLHPRPDRVCRKGWPLVLLGLFAAAASSHELDFTDIVKQVGPAVVNIQALVEADAHMLPHDDTHRDPGLLDRFFGGPDAPPMLEALSTGSGFIISADGFIVTNWHVVGHAREIRVRLNDRREFTAEVVGRDVPTDIALLRIEGEDLPVVKIGDSDQLRVGDWVVAIGSPFNFENSVTAGIISAKGRSFPQQQYVPFLQTDVPINRGNSGGPLLDLEGRVIGVNSQIFSENGTYMGLSFSIPIDIAMAVVEQLRDQGSVDRGLLGVGIEDVTRELADSLGLDEPRGAIVTFVTEDSAAARAGLKPWDVIVALNDRPINRYSELPPRVGLLPPGTAARLAVFRDGRMQEIEAQIGRFDNDDGLPEAPGEESVEPAVERMPRLGLSLEPRPAGGLLINGIESAEVWRAGLRRGDVIHDVNQRPVDSVDAFEQRLEGVGRGPVALLVQRGQGYTYIVVPRVD